MFSMCMLITTLLGSESLVTILVLTLPEAVVGRIVPVVHKAFAVIVVLVFESHQAPGDPAREHELLCISQLPVYIDDTANTKVLLISHMPLSVMFREAAFRTLKV